MKKILAQVLIFSLLFNMCVPAFADNHIPTQKEHVKQHQDTADKAKQQLIPLGNLKAQLVEELEKAWDEAAKNNTPPDIADLLQQLENVEAAVSGTSATYQIETQKALRATPPAQNTDLPIFDPGIKVITHQQISADELADMIERNAVNFEDLIGFVSPVNPYTSTTPTPDAVAAAAMLIGKTVELIPFKFDKDDGNYKENLQAIASNIDNPWGAQHPYRTDFRYIQHILLRKMNELKEKEKGTTLDALPVVTNRTALETLALGEIRIALWKIIKFHLDNGLSNPITFHDTNASAKETGFTQFQEGDNAPQNQRDSQIALLQTMQDDFFEELRDSLDQAKYYQSTVAFQRATYFASTATKYVLLNDPKQLTRLVNLVDQARGNWKLFDLIPISGVHERTKDKLDYHFASVVAAVFSAITQMVEEDALPEETIRTVMEQLAHFVSAVTKETQFFNGAAKMKIKISGKEEDIDLFPHVYTLPTRVSALEAADAINILHYTAETAAEPAGTINKIPALTEEETKTFYKEAFILYAPLVAQYTEAHSVYGLNPEKAEVFADGLVEIMDRFVPHAGNHVNFVDPANPQPDGYYMGQPILVRASGRNQNPSLRENHTVYIVKEGVGFVLECFAWVYIPEMLGSYISNIYRAARGAVAAFPRAGWRAVKAAAQAKKELQLAREARLTEELVTGERAAQKALQAEREAEKVAKGKQATQKVAEELRTPKGGKAPGKKGPSLGNPWVKENPRVNAAKMSQGLEDATEGAAGALVKVSEEGNLPAAVAQEATTPGQVLSSVVESAKATQAAAETPVEAFFRTFFEAEKMGIGASKGVRAGAKRDLLTLFTRNEKGEEVIIKSNAELKQLIRDGQLEKGGFFAKQPGLDGNFTYWRLPVPTGANYVDIGNSLLRTESWEVLSGAERTMAKYGIGERNAISEKVKLRSVIEAKLAQNGGVNAYVLHDGYMRLVSELSPEALKKLGAQTTIYLVPEGTALRTTTGKVIKSSARKAEGAATDLISLESIEQAGAVAITQGEWMNAAASVFPDILMENISFTEKGLVAPGHFKFTAETGLTAPGRFGFTPEGEFFTSPSYAETLAQMFYYTSNRAAANAATPLVLFNGRGANMLNALAKGLPQVKVAPAFARTMAPEWMPENLKRFFSYTQRLASSHTAQVARAFGLFIAIDQVPLFQDAFLKMCGFFAQIETAEALEKTPALRKYLDEHKNDPQDDSQTSILDKVAVAGNGKPQGLLLTFPLIFTLKTYTQIRDWTGVTAGWSGWHFVSDAQKEAMLITNYQLTIAEATGKFLEHVSKESDVASFVTSLDNLEKDIKGQKDIPDIIKADDSYFKTMYTIFENAKANARAGKGDNLPTVGQWLQMDQEVAYTKMYIRSFLEDTDIVAKQRLNSVMTQYLNKAQAIQKDATKTDAQKEAALKTLCNNTIEEMKMVQEVSESSLHVMLSGWPPFPQLQQTITTAYKDAREVIYNNVSSFTQKRQARNNARKEIDMLSIRLQYARFLRDTTTRDYLDYDPAFKKQLEEAWDRHIKTKEAIYQQTNLSDEEQKQLLKNEEVRFDNVCAKMMNNEEIKVFLLEDATKYSLALVYPEYDKKVRAYYNERNAALTKNIQNTKQSEEEQKQAAQKLENILIANLEQETLAYTAMAGEDPHFWSKLAHAEGANEQIWVDTVHSFLALDSSNLATELEEAGITVDPRLTNEIADTYEAFHAQVKLIYQAEDVDAEMKEFIQQMIAYKGAIMASYRNRKQESKLW